MGELIFIGLGLYDASDITVKGLEEARSCDVLFAEFYTARLGGATIEDIERLLGTGKRIRALGRTEVEDGTVILNEARTKKVALLVGGDPMSATTHIDLRLRARKEGIGTRVVNAPSIVTAAASACGLQVYKFGRIITIPFPREGFRPTSPYDMLADNAKAGLHTLVLLDIDAEEDRLMTANEAMRILLDIEAEKGKGAFTEASLVCVVARAGSKDMKVMAGPVNVLIKEEFGPPHHSMIVPGKLHFMEAEALVELAGAPRTILEK